MKHRNLAEGDSISMKQDAGAVLFTINLKSLAAFYERVVGMKVLMTAEDHIRLEAGSFRLTVHAIPERYAKNITITTPPQIRESSAVKLAFRVEDIARAREIAAQFGGASMPQTANGNTKAAWSVMAMILTGTCFNFGSRSFRKFGKVKGQEVTS
jgi:hypothetical protein